MFNSTDKKVTGSKSLLGAKLLRCTYMRNNEELHAKAMFFSATILICHNGVGPLTSSTEVEPCAAFL